MSNMGNYFQRTYDTISDFVPSFSLFGSDGDDGDDDDEDDDDASKKRKPKLKHSLYSKHPNKVQIQEKNNNRWFDKFFYGSEDGEETTSTPAVTPMPKVKITTESGFFSWLGGSAEVTEKPTEAPTEQGNKNDE